MIIVDCANNMMSPVNRTKVVERRESRVYLSDILLFCLIRKQVQGEKDKEVDDHFE